MQHTLLQYVLQYDMQYNLQWDTDVECSRSFYGELYQQSERVVTLPLYTLLTRILGDLGMYFYIFLCMNTPNHPLKPIAT